MRAKIILHNFATGRAAFRLSSGTRPWGILLAISKGSFRLSFPSSDQSYTILPYEIAYVPSNTEFHREILEPIDFHQFTFKVFDQADPTDLPAAGRLNIPKQQVRAILDSADKISVFPSAAEQLSEHILHRILTDNYLFSSTSSASRISQEMLWVSDYIQQHLSEPLSVAMLAEKLHLSHNGLIWKFKKELNVTPVNYINMCRIKHAKQLLFDSDLTISQIAEDCGYANAYYFSNAFKKLEGISPSGFRKKCFTP